MTSNDMTPTQLAYAWFENVWNEKDESFIHKHLAKDCAVRGVGGPGNAITSPDEFIEFWQGMIDAVPDINVEIVRFIESVDEGIGFAKVTGTDAKTRASVEFQLGIWFKTEAGMIVEGENIVDFHTYLAQVAAIPGDALHQHFA